MDGYDVVSICRRDIIGRTLQLCTVHVRAIRYWYVELVLYIAHI